jgi:xylulokinase
VSRRWRVQHVARHRRGRARSELWLRIVAAVLGIPVDIPAAGDFGGAFGAARLGLIAATGADYRHICTPPRIARTVKPDMRIQMPYEMAYARYVQIYPAMKEIDRL